MRVHLVDAIPSEARPIPGLEPYVTTPEGDVFRVDSRFGTAGWRMAAWTNHQGRACVSLTVDGRQRAFFRSRLILLAFVGPAPSPVHVARHMDGDLTHDSAGNLAWGTNSENQMDRHRHGTAWVGAANREHKLTPDSVRLIRARLAAGETANSIARDLGVSKTPILDVKHGRRWNHVV